MSKTFLEAYEELNRLNEKWYRLEDFWGRIWFSESEVQFRDFMSSLSSNGLKGVRLIVAPNFYLIANAEDFNHDTMCEIAESELYVEVPSKTEWTTCGVPKCVDFEQANYELEDLDNDYDPTAEYKGMLVANYGTFEISLYNFKSKECPDYKPRNASAPYFEESETYKALKPLLKRIYIY